MNRKKIRMLSCVLVLLVISSLTSCSKTDVQKESIKQTLVNFQSACNNADIDGMVDCINPTISKPIQVGMALISTLSGDAYDEMLEEISTNIADSVFGQDYGGMDFLKSISFSDMKITVNKDKATVECTIQYKIAGELFDNYTTINMIKKDDDWYISGVDIVPGLS